MKKIKIYDAIMGSGKTYNAIQKMNEYIETDRKFIYVTPFLSEVNRVIVATGNKAFAPKSPEEDIASCITIEENYIDENGKIDLNAEKSFRFLNKREQFIQLALNGKNIVTTHSLFTRLHLTDYKLLNEYTLILDEVITPISCYRIGAQDIKIMSDQKLIHVDSDTSLVTFINEEYTDPAFQATKKLCTTNTLYLLDKHYFVSLFPIEIFNSCKEIQILTYLFEGSLLCSYFKLYKMEYDVISNHSLEQLQELKYLLNIYEGCYGGHNSFSKSWTERLSKIEAKRVSHITSNTFKRVFNTKSNENAFTAFKASRAKLSGKGYTKGFIPVNARASNEYSHKESMAYLANRYFDPQTMNFFKERNIVLNEDLWALTELIQWVWRGCIRENKPMNLYIPNSRMKTLLTDWLEGKYLNYPKMNVIAA